MALSHNNPYGAMCLSISSNTILYIWVIGHSNTQKLKERKKKKLIDKTAVRCRDISHLMPLLRLIPNLRMYCTYGIPSVPDSRHLATCLPNSDERRHLCSKSSGRPLLVAK